MGLFEKLQAKLELYRLEQRYTRRDKRTTFISDARYIDGEYVHSGSSPSSPYSSTSNGNRRWSKMPTSAVKEFGEDEQQSLIDDSPAPHLRKTPRPREGPLSKTRPFEGRSKRRRAAAGNAA